MTHICRLEYSVTEGVDKDKANALVRVLRAHLKIGEPRFFMRRAGYPIEQYIQLLGTWEIWVAAFGIVATGFLAKLGQRAADGFWDTVRDRLKGSQSKPLADFSEALTDTGLTVGDHQIILGLNIPDGHFGTALVIREKRPEAIAYATARFVVMAQKISSSMAEEIAAGRGPLGRANITLMEDGSVTVDWMTHDFKRRELILKTD
jgi:hypothetical protein